MAGPTIVARIGDHRSAHGVEFDVAVAVHEVAAVADQTGFVTSFPQGAAAVVCGVDVSNIAPPKSLHKAWDGAFRRWRQQQVDMVRHQHIRMDRAALAAGHVTQFAAIAQVVSVVEEAWLAVVAPLNDMLRNTGKIYSQWTRHSNWQRDKS